MWVPARVPHAAVFSPDYAPFVCSTGDRTGYGGGDRTGDGSGPGCATALPVGPELRRRLLAAGWEPGGPGELVTAELLRRREAHEAAELPVVRPRGALSGPIASALAQDPSDPRTVDDWARELHAGAATIRRAFVNDTGVSFSAWRRRVRLRESLVRLRAGEPVGDVAYAVGLTHNGLIAAYHRAFGVPPTKVFQPAGPAGADGAGAAGAAGPGADPTG